MLGDFWRILRYFETLREAWRCSEILRDTDRRSETLGDPWRCFNTLEESLRHFETLRDTRMMLKDSLDALGPKSLGSFLVDKCWTRRH